MVEPARRRARGAPRGAAARGPAARPGERLRGRCALSGQAEIDAAAQVPRFALELGTQQTSLGGLAELLFGLEGIEGKMGRFSVEVGAHGDSGGELMGSLDVQLNVARSNFTYGNVEGGRPVEFTLETLDFRMPPGRALTAQLRGTLLGERFAADLTGGDLRAVAADQRVPLKLTASAPGATLAVDGTLAAPGKQEGTDLAFRLRGRRAGDLSSWLGVSPAADAPILIEGRARVQADEWRLSGFLVRLGRSALRGELARTGIGAKPLITAKLDIDLIDVVELETMLPPPAERPRKAEVRDQGAMLDLPVLPAGIDMSDADVEVRVKRVALRAADVTDASFSGHIREGRMTPSPFAANIARSRSAARWRWTCAARCRKPRCGWRRTTSTWAGCCATSRSCRTWTQAWSRCACSSSAAAAASARCWRSRRWRSTWTAGTSPCAT